MEPFAVVDRYDVRSGTDSATVTLRTLVGTITDEEVGNDSYIGALASIDSGAGLQGEYFVMCVVKRVLRPKSLPRGYCPNRCH